MSRIRLRPIEHEDLPFLQSLANDTVVRERVVGWDWPVSMADQERWFVSGANTSTTRRFVVESTSGDRLGLTGLWDIDWHNRSALTALKLGGDPGNRGKGYGAEAVQALMRFAFNDVGLNRLHSTILETNLPSLVVYIRKSGWSEEGRLRQHVWRDGKFLDAIQIGILASEFASAGLAQDDVGKDSSVGG
ncbi:N-acetyltransferase [Salinibacterium sp. UTAS2018]|uniref:GNAT family N-acetyltransferase n=1 Tax=Salinibacterium sp. UTAS2018 TaxID=2508880 RepID=UPI0010094649|nr:GNAT family protein [Salinibacterium sp. UTAS2018]QAV70548.1 N-acetyltransferase [Salinibacterium sp. UTAS2018]